MARRQLEIAGTRTDKDIPIALVEAGEDLVEQRRVARREGEKVKEKYAGVVAVMQANSVPTFQVKDPDTGEYLDFNLEMVAKLTIRKSGEADTEIGDGIPSGGEDVQPAGMGGLIAQALASQNEQNVEETTEGDVAVPDKAAPKKAKKGRKAK